MYFLKCNIIYYVYPFEAVLKVIQGVFQLGAFGGRVESYGAANLIIRPVSSAQYS